MRKILYVGDPHIVATELDDADGLMKAIWEALKRDGADTIVFLGDQYHAHSILHVDVVNFWIKAFRALREMDYTVIALVGNHDLPGNGSREKHAMQIHEGEIQVVDGPYSDAGILFLPYYAVGEDFLSACKQYSYHKVVVCHQGFTGATYDNGFKIKGTDFYTEGGIDPNLVPQATIISGHIHTPQEFGKVWYLGAPRWRTLSDANKDRWLYTITHNDDGTVKEAKALSMEGYCRPIYSIEETPETEQKDAGSFLASNESADLRVDLRGPSAWVEARKSIWMGLGAKVRVFKTDTALIKVKESDGIAVAFASFFEKFQPRFGTDKAILRKLVEERLSVV